MKTGGSAFPTTQYANGISPSGHDEGMTLRDYFAAKAMAAYWFDPTVAGDYKTAAAWAYDMADAMLKVRNGNS